MTDKQNSGYKFYSDLEEKINLNISLYEIKKKKSF